MCEQSQAIQWTYRRRLLGAARSESGSRGRVPTQEPGTWTCPSHDAARQRHEPSSQSAHAYLRGRPGSPRNKCSGGATRRAPPTASSARKRRHDAERAGHHQPRDSGDPTRTPADTTTKRRRPHSAASPKNSSSFSVLTASAAASASSVALAAAAVTTPRDRRATPTAAAGRSCRHRGWPKLPQARAPTAATGRKAAAMTPGRAGRGEE